MSKTDKVKAKLAKNPNPSPEEIKGWATEIGCSKGLVYKWLTKMPERQRMAETPAEPVISIGEEEEVIIEKPPTEETVESEFEVPEFTEHVEETAEITEEEPAEIGLEEDEEEQRILKSISKRAVKRLFKIAIEEGLGLGKDYGLTDQESEDTEFLIMVMISKYLMIEVKENLLEVTGALHFGSIGAKLLIAWIKKRRAEQKTEEEKPVKTPETAEKPEIVKPEETATEETSVEVPMPTEEETKKDAEEIKTKEQKQSEKAFLKRVNR